MSIYFYWGECCYILFGESSTLTASSGFDSYQWYNDDGAIEGAVASTYTATTGGHYYAIGLTSSGCSITSNGIIDYDYFICC